MKKTETFSVADEFKARFPGMAEQLGPHLAALLDGATLQEIAAGRVLIRDRMPLEFLYAVIDGELGVHIENGGKSMRIATVRPGEWLGELSVLSGELVASATITANTACRLVRIHHLTLEKLISTNEVVAQVLLEHFIELMAKRLRGSPTGD